MATSIAKFKIGAFKKTIFGSFPLESQNLGKNLVFMYSSLMTELKKKFRDISQNKILVCIQKCKQHL